jgi:multisubunit Na+/H+ antiporter MnhC subunit
MKILFKIAVVALIICLLTTSAFAESPGNTGDMKLLVGIIFWAVRLIIVAVGAVPGLIKIVQGNSNEDTRERNAGVAALIITGIVVGASFPIEGMFNVPPPGA